MRCGFNRSYLFLVCIPVMSFFIFLMIQIFSQYLTILTLYLGLQFFSIVFYKLFFDFQNQFDIFPFMYSCYDIRNLYQICGALVFFFVIFYWLFFLCISFCWQRRYDRNNIFYDLKPILNIILNRRSKLPINEQIYALPFQISSSFGRSLFFILYSLYNHLTVIVFRNYTCYFDFKTNIHVKKYYSEVCITNTDYGLNIAYMVVYIILTIYFFLLFIRMFVAKMRKRLNYSQKVSIQLDLLNYSILYRPYKKNFYFFSVFDFLYSLILVMYNIISFLDHFTWLRYAIFIILIFIYIILILVMKPYHQKVDHFISLLTVLYF
jgi:hypothetical protein